jgi:hypothetical protein
VKIAFLCGSCEPSADGVGDYTISLAEALSERGHNCMIIALNDRFLDCQNDAHEVLNRSPLLTLIRLPSASSWRSKTKNLSATLKRFAPDWISLQYVPYAFDRRGLPLPLIPCLWVVRYFSKWHVMIHELWVDPDVSFKNRLLAFFQKQLLRFILGEVAPSLMHSTNQYYTFLLASIRRQASILPLFSTIPVCPRDTVSGLNNRHWSFIFFGSIHPEWEPDLILGALESASRFCGISSLSFTSIGNAGVYGRQLWLKLASTTPNWMQFIQLGPLPACEISLHLQNADWGVTTTPSHLLGKSGSVAAMRAHDLPVIVPRLEKTHGPWHQKLLDDQSFILLDSSFVARLSNASRLRQSRTLQVKDHNQLTATTEQFLQSLQAAE